MIIGLPVDMQKTKNKSSNSVKTLTKWHRILRNLSREGPRLKVATEDMKELQEELLGKAHAKQLNPPVRPPPAMGHSTPVG